MATSLKNIKVCSINICGFSSRSKLVVDKYIHDEGCDIVLMQETGTNDINKLKLLNMNTIADTNQAYNRGASVNANHQHSITQLSMSHTGGKSSHHVAFPREQRRRESPELKVRHNEMHRHGNSAWTQS